jgi:hypothetical protein
LVFPVSGVRARKPDLRTIHSILADRFSIAKEFCAAGRNLPVNRAGHAHFVQNDKESEWY